MGGGPSGSSQSTTKTSPWGPSGPYGKLYLGEIANAIFPGAFPTPNIPALGIGGRNGGSLPGLPSMPSDLYQQTAPSNAYENMAMQGIGGMTPAAMNLTGLGANTMAQYASGQMQNNPFLNNYYNQAANQLTQQYQNATMPGIMANGAQTGSVGGTGYNNAIQQAQYGLGQGLATLGANIYEPAYQQGQQLQYGAAQGLPGAAMSLYSPLSALYGAGATQQQGEQNVLNTNYQNALAAQNYPFQLIGQLGSAFGATSGAGGTTISTQPMVGGGMGGKM